MATRFYLPIAGSPAVSPAFGSGWDVQPNPARFPLVQTKTGSGASTSASADGTETSASVVNVLIRQFVSDDTIPSARTISGSFSAAVRGFQSNAAADGFLQFIVRVVSGDGTTTRGYLYAGATQTAVSTTVGAQNEELPTSTTTIERIWDTIPLTSVAAQAGDRIVVEMGWRATNLNTTSYNVRLATGNDPTYTDLPLASGSTTTTTVPWVEFSQDLFVASPGSVSGSLAATLPPLSATLAGDVPMAATSGTLTGTMPRLTASIAGLLPVTGSLSGNLPALTGTIDAQTDVNGTMAATLPAIADTFYGSVQSITDTDLTYSNDGYNYDGTAEVTYDPPVAPDPPSVHRTPVRRVHQSLPAPTLVDGRPT